MKIRDFLLKEATRVKFTLKWPASVDELTWNFLYVITHNGMTNLFNKMADERGMAAPITVQVMEDWKECDKALKKAMSDEPNLSGEELVRKWWKICKEFYTLDFPPARSLMKKVRGASQAMRW